MKTNIFELKTLRSTSGLSKEALEQLASVGIKKKLRTNEPIFSAGDPGEFAAIVVSGLVEGARHGAPDEEAIIGLFGPSDVIGLPAVLKRTTYPGNAKALSKDTEIIKCYLRPLLQTRSVISEELNLWAREMLLLHGQILQDKIDILNAGNIEQKILTLLLHLIRRFGRQESQFRYSVPVRLTRAQIGRLTKARVETVIRVLSSWRRENLLRWSEEGVVVENLPLLQRSLKHMI